MKFHQPDAELFIPDQTPPADAIRRITHLGIGAHQDDLEFMAFHGILACYRQPGRGFGAVICTDGAGSARTGPYANCSDEEMRAIRREEQRNAARIGQYAALAQLGYPSSAAKNPDDAPLVEDLAQILDAARPEFVYTHNPADKHPTHVGVTIATLRAIRSLPPDARPKTTLGCEVWRSLDWMPDNEKIPLDVSSHDNLAAALGAVFDSQIGGGKRYDLATAGRRRANATFFESHHTDQAEQLWFAMDLTPLTREDGPDPVTYVTGFIDRFRDDVRSRLEQRLGR